MSNSWKWMYLRGWLRMGWDVVDQELFLLHRSPAFRAPLEAKKWIAFGTRCWFIRIWLFPQDYADVFIWAMKRLGRCGEENRFKKFRFYMFNGASDKGNEKRNHVSFLWSVCAMLHRATPPRPFFVCRWLPVNFRFELSVETRCLRHEDVIVCNDYYNIFLLPFTDARFTRSCWSRSRYWSSDSSFLRVRSRAW